MEFLQSTLDEITESEGKMPLLARARYGEFYGHAVACSVFLSNCITEIDHSRMMFGRFLSLTKKHHMLAVLSTVRLHRVQAMMNLRQVLEAGAAAAFAIANPEVHHFAETDKHGILDASPELAKKRYRWLNKHYHTKSEWIRITKDRINESAAHANVVSSESVFHVGEDEKVANAPFFDVEDEYFVKSLAVGCRCTGIDGSVLRREQGARCYYFPPKLCALPRATGANDRRPAGRAESN